MISSRPRGLALASTILFLAACSSSPVTGSTGTGGATSTSASTSDASTAGAGGGGGASASASVTSSASASTSSASSSASSGSSSSSSSGAGGGVATCADAIDATLAMETAGLLYTSESDYPFDTVNVKDPQGDGPIVPAHLMALLGVDPASTIETRTVDFFFTNLLAGPDAAKYQIVLGTLKGKLTDLAVIRFIPPSPNSAQVHVYVVGRTGCGEIAGLTTISIET